MQVFFNNFFFLNILYLWQLDITFCCSAKILDMLLQRVPVTEKSGRVHTSAVSVAILPQADQVQIPSI